MSTPDDRGPASDLERAGLAPGTGDAHRGRESVDLVLDYLRATRADDARDIATLRSRLENRSQSRVRRHLWTLPAACTACSLLAALAAAWLPGTKEQAQPVTVAGEVSPEVLANIDFYQWLARQQRLERNAQRDLPIRRASQETR